MNITIKLDDIGYSTQPKQAEILARAREIRQFGELKNGSSGSGRWEYFVWKTQTRRGFELEEVIIDNTERTLEYSFRRI